LKPAGRRVKRFVEKSWFCWHLTKSAVHPTRSRWSSGMAGARLFNELAGGFIKMAWLVIEIAKASARNGEGIYGLFA